MDLFFLSWVFDRRWLMGLKNPVKQMVFVVPFILNLGTAVWVYIEKRLNTSDKITFLVETLVLLTLLALSNIYIICIVRINGSGKTPPETENYEAIENFHKNYELKKVIWSPIGLIITLLAVCQTIVQSLFLNQNDYLYDCLPNKIRLYLDVFFYCYIVSMIILFFAVKITYILSAWIYCPRFYMRLKGIIQ